MALEFTPHLEACPLVFLHDQDNGQRFALAGINQQRLQLLILLGIQWEGLTSHLLKANRAVGVLFSGGGQKSSAVGQIHIGTVAHKLMTPSLPRL